MFNWNVQSNPIQPRLRAQVEVHRQTVLLTRDADAAARQLYARKVIFASSGVVANQNAQLGFTKTFPVRDADGHAIEIEQK